MNKAKGINPKMLKFFREKVGYSLDCVAKRMKISKVTLIKWEEGEKIPTIRQAMNMGQIYKKTWASFFLKEKPKFQLLKDFRTVLKQNKSKYSPRLNFLIDEALQQQQWTREYLINNGYKKNKLIGSWKRQSDYHSLSERIKEILEIDYELISKKKTRQEVLSYYISLVENVGIFICKTSGVGIATEEMRGMFLFDEYTPFIFLNSNDSISGQIFTLAHEVAHFMLGKEGVSNMRFNENNFIGSEKTEMFCNRVASEIVLPKNILLEKWKNFQEVNDFIENISRLFKISEESIAYKLFLLDVISKAKYQEIQEKTKDIIKNRKKKGGSGDYHRNKISRNGKLLTRTVLSAYKGGEILTLDAANVLGVRVNHLEIQAKYAHAV